MTSEWGDAAGYDLRALVTTADDNQPAGATKYRSARSECPRSVTEMIGWRSHAPGQVEQCVIESPKPL